MLTDGEHFSCYQGKTWHHKSTSHNLLSHLTFQFALNKTRNKLILRTKNVRFQLPCINELYFTVEMSILNQKMASYKNSLPLAALSPSTAHCLQSSNRFLLLDGITHFVSCSLVFWSWSSSNYSVLNRMKVCVRAVTTVPLTYFSMVLLHLLQKDPSLHLIVVYLAKQCQLKV